MILKLFIILISIFLLVVFGLNFLKNRIKKIMFGNFEKQSSNFSNFNAQSQRQKQDKEVLYQKDDTVILKGEAKSKNKKDDSI
ncbi:hypothetical protein OAQ99_06545 [Candidatus Kapabacteria bacterium]|nr:hypothetical protein [Candidatus Kapabacteria bacterium]